LQAASVARQCTPPKDDENHDETQNPFHKYGKTGLLFFVWVLMVFFLTRTPEKKLEKIQILIPIDEEKVYNFLTLPAATRINVTLEGAFLPDSLEQSQKRQDALMNRKTHLKAIETEKENYLRVYLRSSNKRQLTLPKHYAITPPEQFDFSNNSKLIIMFDIGEDNLEELEGNNEKIQLVIESNFTTTPHDRKQEMPLIFGFDLHPINKYVILFMKLIN
jgi:hypothetical protein